MDNIILSSNRIIEIPNKLSIKLKSLTKKNSSPELNKIEYCNEFPFIKSKKSFEIKQKSNKKPILKNILFNPLSYIYQKRIKLLSQITPISNNINKFYSLKEIKSFTKRQNYPKNSSQTMADCISLKSRNKKKIKLIKRNISDANIINKKRPFLSIIDLTNNYDTKEDDINKNKKSEKKSKIIFNNNHHYILNKFQKNLLEKYNPLNYKTRKYQINPKFVHDFLYNKKQNEINDTNEINSKYEYEYINYFGITHKLITKLTSSNINPEEKITYTNNKNNCDNNYVKIKIKSNLMNYKNNDDLRNKKYIEQIQKKINIEKAMNKINQEIKKDEINILNEKRKKRFKKIMERKNNNFMSLVKNAFNEHNKINKKLSNLVEIDKKTYEKDFNSIK